MTRATARIGACLLALACLLAAPGARAQDAALQAQRDAVFARLLQAPADRALMLDYARLSVALRDFEAAAATLERFVDLDPGNAAARLELATAYFALGAYGVAEYHLAVAAGSGALTPEQSAQAARYGAQAAARQEPRRLEGQIALGQARGRDTGTDSLFVTAALDWRIDMGGPDANDWRTQLGFSRDDPDDPGQPDRQVARLRSGPEFRITGDAYGPRLHPYAELSWTRDATGRLPDRRSMALGLAYQNPHDAFWTSYADLRIGRGEGLGAAGAGFDLRGASLGLAYRPSRETRLRATLGWTDLDADAGAAGDETTTSLRLEVLHSFDTGWAGLPRRWEARGWAARARVAETDRFGRTADYSDTALGFGLRAFVTDALFLEARGTRLDRDPGTPLRAARRDTVLSLRIGWEF